MERTLYRNAPFYTLGSPLYLDLNSEADYSGYKAKAAYFNKILWPMVHLILANQKAVRDIKLVSGLSLPGFHIFPPHKTTKYFFGKFHEDRQWSVFPKLPFMPPEWKNLPPESHFSFTYTSMLPHSGSGLLIGDESNYFPYEQNALYVHSGQFMHAIAPTRGPIIPTDFRITFQGHGFIHKGTSYLYW